MSETKEMQDDEREALISIYEGDNCFKQVSPTLYQYKYGEDEHIKSFLVEISWGENYPNELPIINMETFYNRNIIAPIKQKIISTLVTEGNQWLGCGMTYTLFECLKDHIEDLIAEQPETISSATLNTSSTDDLPPIPIKTLSISTSANNDEVTTKPQKKEQLTKAQKRRQWERTDHKGDKERGWNWVDVVKHLSQTGGSKDKSNTTDATTSNSNVVLVSS